jgi:hypothetical protein
MVIGSIVMAGTVTWVGEIYNATNPVIQAQKQTLAYLESSGPELEESIAREERLTAKIRERQFGKQYAIKLQAQIAAHAAAFAAVRQVP